MNDKPVNEKPAPEKPVNGEIQVANALKSVHSTLDKIHGCSDAERENLRDDLRQLEAMAKKLTDGQVEIVVFGEIKTST